MSRLNLHPDDVKLVYNFFYNDEQRLDSVIERLEGIYGPIDHRMEALPFSHTTYYENEIGPEPKKLMLSFRDLVPRDCLVQVKHEAVQLEQTLANAEGDPKARPVNIDPGLLFPEKLVLATGKNYTHRIYLGQGVYADLTLQFRHDRFEALPWTYTDYLEPAVLRFLGQVRTTLIAQLRALRDAR